MPGKILGIDINEDFIAAVQVAVGLKGFQVLSCASAMIDKEKGLSEALRELSGNMDLKSDEYIVSLDSGNISFQNLVMPFKDPKKIKQTLPFEIESLIPFLIEDIVIDFNITRIAEQSEILAICAKKALISERLEKLKTFGISPGIIDIKPVPLVLRLLSLPETPDNGIVIDIGLKWFTIALFLDRKTALIRGMPLTVGNISSSPLNPEVISRETMEKISGTLSLHIKNTLHSFSMQMKRKISPEKAFITGAGSQYPRIAETLADQTGIAVEKIDISKDNKINMDAGITAKWRPAIMNNALSLAVRDLKKGHGFNLRKGEFEVKENIFKSIKEIKKVGIAILVIILFLIMDFGVDYYFLKKRYAAAEQRCADLFSQSFPDIKGVNNRIPVIIQKMDELKSSIALLSGDTTGELKMIDLIKDISQRIPGNLEIDVTRISIETDTATITGETDSFNTLTNIENGLKSSPYYDVEIEKGEDAKTGQSVEFVIKLQITK